MTSTVSFKDKLKQIFSVILWDLKGCKGSLMVYTILASVFTVIIFTLVFDAYGDQTSIFAFVFQLKFTENISKRKNAGFSGYFIYHYRFSYTYFCYYLYCADILVYAQQA